MDSSNTNRMMMMMMILSASQKSSLKWLIFKLYTDQVLTKKRQLRTLRTSSWLLSYEWKNSFFSLKCKMQNVSSRKLGKARKFLGFRSFFGFRMKKKQKVPLFSQVDKKREFNKIRRKRVFPPCLKVVHPASSSVFWKHSIFFTFVWKSVLFPTTLPVFSTPSLDNPSWVGWDPC